MPRSHREGASADAVGQGPGIFRRGFLAVGLDQLAEGGEERSLGHAIAVEPVELGLGERLGDVAQGGVLPKGR